MKIFRTVIKYPLECIGGAAFSLMALVIFVQVIWRYVFRSPLPWPEELARLLFIWTSFIAASLGIKLGSHYKVDFFVDLLPPKAKATAGVIFDLVLLFTTAYWGWQGIRGLAAPAQQKFPALGISMVWLYLPLPVGCGLMVMFLFKRLCRDVGLLGRFTDTPSGTEGH